MYWQLRLNNSLKSIQRINYLVYLRFLEVLNITNNIIYFFKNLSVHLTGCFHIIHKKLQHPSTLKMIYNFPIIVIKVLTTMLLGQVVGWTLSISCIAK